MIDPTKVVSGGKFDESARYPDPTILYPVSWSDKVMQDEVFGPILPILTYSDLGKLLAKIKSLPKPLAGYLFSRNQQTIDQVLRSLSFGGGAVNQIPAQRGHRSLVSALHHGKGGSSQPVV
jgi:aldehyde dehydrogenase (NAD+)